MTTKITYTHLNPYGSITSLQESTYYDICIETALKLLKAEGLHNLKIIKIETI
jgi:hypothetical protein